MRAFVRATPSDAMRDEIDRRHLCGVSTHDHRAPDGSGRGGGLVFYRTAGVGPRTSEAVAVLLDCVRVRRCLLVNDAKCPDAGGADFVTLAPEVVSLAAAVNGQECVASDIDCDAYCAELVWALSRFITADEEVRRNNSSCVPEIYYEDDGDPFAVVMRCLVLATNSGAQIMTQIPEDARFQARAFLLRQRGHGVVACKA